MPHTPPHCNASHIPALWCCAHISTVMTRTPTHSDGMHTPHCDSTHTSTPRWHAHPRTMMARTPPHYDDTHCHAHHRFALLRTHPHWNVTHTPTLCLCAHTIAALLWTLSHCAAIIIITILIINNFMNRCAMYVLSFKTEKKNQKRILLDSGICKIN